MPTRAPAVIVTFQSDGWSGGINHSIMSDRHQYSVVDVSCDHCKAAIESEVSAVDGVNNVEAASEGWARPTPLP